MDVFERRKMFKEMADPNVTQETIAKWQKKLAERPVEEQYGELIEMAKDKVSGGVITFIDATCGDEHYKGQRIEAAYRGQQVPYYVTDSWISGKGITVENAYRIFEETDARMAVRKVTQPSELECIADGLRTNVRKMIDKKG